MKILKIVIFTCLLITSHVFANGTGRGGGDGFSCFGEKGLSDIDLDRQNFIPDNIFEFSNDEVVFDSLMSYVKQTQPDLYLQLKAIDSTMTFKIVPKLNKVSTGVSAGFWMSTLGCKRVQYAVQNFNINTVYLTESSYNQLHTLTQGLLRLHELFLKLEYSPNDNLAEIETRARKRVQDIFNAKNFNRILIREVATNSVPKKTPANVLEEWAHHLETYDPASHDLTFFIKSFMKLPKTIINEAKLDGADLEKYLWRLSWSQLLDAGLDINSNDSNGNPLILGLFPERVKDKGKSGYFFVEYNDRADLIANFVRERELNLDQKNVQGEPFLIQLYDQGGGDPVMSLGNNQKPDLTYALHLNYNVWWCKPGANPGDYVSSLLDYAYEYQDNYSMNDFKSHGAKTGRELGITCPK